MTEKILKALQRHTNDKGLALADERALCKELQISRSELSDGLRKLSQARVLEILSPLPFLVAKVRGRWSGRREKPLETTPSAYSAIQLSQSKRLNSSYRQAGAHWPVDAALLSEILETLGETDGKSFEKAVELYSPHIIRTALDRVRRAKGIRKSRTALFRHLLPRLARDEHRFDPSV